METASSTILDQAVQLKEELKAKFAGQSASQVDAVIEIARILCRAEFHAGQEQELNEVGKRILSSLDPKPETLGL